MVHATAGGKCDVTVGVAKTCGYKQIVSMPDNGVISFYIVAYSFDK